MFKKGFTVTKMGMSVYVFYLSSSTFLEVQSFFALVSSNVCLCVFATDSNCFCLTATVTSDLFVVHRCVLSFFHVESIAEQ